MKPGIIQLLYASLLCCLLIFSGCSQVEISTLLYIEAKECHQSGEEVCIVSVKEVADWLEWEYMYYFTTSNSLKEINEALGFEYPYYEDVANRLVFVKEGEIVWHEDNFPYLSENNPPHIFFTLKPGQKYIKFTPVTAVFESTPVINGTNTSFALSQVKMQP